MIKKSIRGVRKTKEKILAFVARHLPKKHDKIIFYGSSNGRYYSDNSKYLFEHASEQEEFSLSFWVTKNNLVYKTLKKTKKKVLKTGSFKYYRYLYSANVGVFTNSIKDLFVDLHQVPHGIELIALRHGKSLKRVRHSVIGYQISVSDKLDRAVESELVKFVISTSKFISDIQEKDLLFGAEKHVVTGYPRNDALLKPLPAPLKKTWDTFLKDLKPNKTILYSPSWRHGREPTRFFPFDDFDENVLFKYLKKNKLLLLLRPHKNDLNKYPDYQKFFEMLEKKSPWIKRFTHNKFPDINSFLPFMDALITDYSSIFHDYLLLDRPVMFIPYDFEEFNKQNGFHVDYMESIPGPAIFEFNEFLKHLYFINNDVDHMKEERQEYTNKIHQYKDGKSTERVYELLKSL